MLSMPKPDLNEIIPYPETGTVPSYPGKTSGYIVKLTPVENGGWSFYTGDDPQSAEGLICFLDAPPNSGKGVRIIRHAKTCVFGKEVTDLN